MQQDLRADFSVSDTDVRQQFLDALDAAIPCLCDWAMSTGYGEVHRRDMNALIKCLRALETHRDWWSQRGQGVPGSAAYPLAVELARDYRG